MKKHSTGLTLGVIDKLFLGLLLVIIGGVVLHAPLTIWLGTLMPEISLELKAWKELLLIPTALFALVIIAQRKAWKLFQSPLVVIALLYSLLHLALVPLFDTNMTAKIAGLLIDLRYIVMFVLMVLAIQLYPQLRRPMLWTVGFGGVIVGLFALLQVFVLPRDVLVPLGYNESTIQPYLTVDENPDYVRINSTLRGPNPLGAYAVILLSLVASYWLVIKRKPRRLLVAGTLIVTVGLSVALWASYSRSALLAGVLALGLVVLFAVGRQIPRWLWLSGGIFALVLAGTLFAARDTSFVSNVILHENATTGGSISSNEGHVESLADGFERLLRQPLGAGIGSTGSASLYTDDTVIIENQYLFVAHETGWLGLTLFLILFVGILKAAWRSRKDWLALGVFASGIGLAVIGLLLPVWVDDTVSLIWWALAGMIVGEYYGRTINQKAKRTA